MVTDAQRFAVIFIFAAILIAGTFGLYKTQAKGLFSWLTPTPKKTSEVYQNDDIGFAFVYPIELTVNADECLPEKKKCTLRFVDANAQVTTNANTVVTQERVVFTLSVAPEHTVTQCSALHGRVEGGFTIERSTYQPCIVPKTETISTEGVHIQTTVHDHTYTLTADDYFGDRALLQGVFATFQFTK